MKLYDEDLSKSYEYILSLTHLHHSQSEDCLDLSPNNSWISSLTRLCLGTHLSNSYYVGLKGKKLNSSMAYIEMLERDVSVKLKILFGYQYSSCHFLSCMQALSAIFFALLEKGDKVLVPSAESGGHFSIQANGPLSLIKAKAVEYTYDPDSFQINLESLEALLLKHQPKLLVLGSSQPLFPLPLAEIHKLCKKSGTKILYDMSHVAGLIAGQQFQMNLNQYVDFLVTTTSKSFHAPNHGILMTNHKDIFEEIEKCQIPLLSANIHPQEIAALAMVLTEWQAFGEAYSEKLVRMTQHFAKCLDALGLEVAFKQEGYTHSHMLILRVPNANQALSLLDQAGIFASLAIMQESEEDTVGTALRLSTHILVRRGFEAEDFEKLAQVFKEVILDNIDPNLVRLKYVFDLSENNRDCLFSFDKSLHEQRSLLEDLHRFKQQSSILELAASIPALSSLSVQELKILEGQFIKTTYQKESFIFRAGEVADSVYFVMQGEVEILDENFETPFLVARTQVGQHLGELGVLSGFPRSFAAKAKPNTICLVLEKQAFIEMVQKNLDLIDYFTKYINDLEVPDFMDHV